MIFEEVDDDAGALGRGLRRQGEGCHEGTLVLIRHKGRRERAISIGNRADDSEVNHHGTPDLAHKDGDPAGITRGQALKGAVEPAEETFLLMVIVTDRLQQGRAQSGREAEGQKCREQDRYGHRDGKLPVDRSNRTGGHAHRQEDGGQDQRDADDRAGYFRHRLARRFKRRQALLSHQALDIFNDHDGVIDNDADCQNHAEHGQGIDRIADRQHDRECAEKRDRRNDGGNKRVTQVLEKQQHDQENQDHGLGERLDYLLYRNLHEGCRIIGDGEFHSLRHGRGKLRQTLPHTGRGAHRIGAGRHLNGSGRRRFAAIEDGEARCL